MERELTSSSSSAPRSQSQAALWVIRQSLDVWWDNWVPIAILGLVWLLSSLTGILAFPATFGLAYALRAILRGEMPSLGDWWKGSREYFWQGCLLSAINLVLAILFWTNIWFYSQLGTPLSLVLRWLFIPIGFLWLVIQFYAFSFLFEQERPHLGIALRNGFYLTLAAPLFTFIVAGVALGLLLVSLFFILPLVLGVPGLILLLSEWAVQERLQAYQLR